MRVGICLPYSEEREFCKKRINELAKSDGISLTVDEVNVALLGDSRFYLNELTDMDIIYIGVSRNCDGIGIAKSIRKAGLNTVVVFFTRSTDAVFDAFDVEALQYLVIGRVNTAKFDEVFRKAVSRAESRTQESIILTCAGEQRRIIISQIYYFEVINRIVTVYYQGGTFEFYSTLSKLEDSLTRRDFIRVHKSYLVSKRYIVTFKRNEIILNNGTVIPVGRKYMNNIQMQ